MNTRIVKPSAKWAAVFLFKLTDAPKTGFYAELFNIIYILISTTYAIKASILTLLLKSMYLYTGNYSVATTNALIGASYLLNFDNTVSSNSHSWTSQVEEDFVNLIPMLELPQAIFKRK